jgi:hypothetical protein
MKKKTKLLELVVGIVMISVIAAALFVLIWPEQHRVVNEEGESIGGAYLISGETILKTDLDGLWDNNELADKTVTVFAQGYETLVTEAVEEIVLTKLPEQSVLTFVHDENGVLADAYLFALDPNSYELAAIHKTDENGLAWFPEQLQGWTVVFVYKEGYEIGWMYLNIAEGNDNTHMLALSPEATVVTRHDVRQEKVLPFIKIAQAQSGPGIVLQADGSGIGHDYRSIEPISVYMAEIIERLEPEFFEIEPLPVGDLNFSSLTMSSTKITSIHEILVKDRLGTAEIYSPITTRENNRPLSEETVADLNALYGAVAKGDTATTLPVSGEGLVVATFMEDADGSVGITTGVMLVNPAAFDFTAGMEPITISKLDVGRTGVSSDVYVEDLYLDLPPVTLELSEPVVPDAQEDNFTIDESDTIKMNVEADLDEGPEEPMEPWQFEPEITPPEPDLEPEVIEPEPEVEEVEESEQAVVEAEEEYQFMCCYDPAYPDEPYFWPFPGDVCTDVPGAYEVNLPESECANDWLLY